MNVLHLRLTLLVNKNLTSDTESKKAAAVMFRLITATQSNASGSCKTFECCSFIQSQKVILPM